MPLPIVAAPLLWSEVEAAVAHGRPERLYFGPEEVRARIDRFGDVFGNALSEGGALPAVDAARPGGA